MGATTSTGIEVYRMPSAAQPCPDGSATTLRPEPADPAQSQLAHCCAHACIVYIPRVQLCIHVGRCVPFHPPTFSTCPARRKSTNPLVPPPRSSTRLPPAASSLMKK